MAISSEKYGKDLRKTLKREMDVIVSLINKIRNFAGKNYKQAIANAEQPKFANERILN